MKTAVIYARYSSDRQTEQSIEGQLTVCNRYAEQNDIIVVGEYIDRAMTGTNDNRAEFQRMLKDSNKKAWDLVLVYKLDRFSRNKYEMAIHRKTLRDNGIKLVSAMENIPDTPEGIILESLLEGMAEYYSVELAQKVRRGMDETRKKGNFTGGIVVFGYRVTGTKANGRKLIIDEDEATIVRKIFNEFVAGRRILDIYNELNEQGVCYNGKPFSHTTIYRLVTNEKYTGIYRLNGKIYDNMYPQIISPELFAMAKQKLDANRYGKHKPDVVYLLKHKLICGYCGKPVNSETGTCRNGEIRRYYKCTNRKNGNCELLPITKDALENFVISTTMEIFSSTGLLNDLANRIIEENEKRNDDNTVLHLLLKQKGEVQKSIENILDAIQHGIVTNATKSRLEKLEAENNMLDASIEEEKSRHKCQIQKSDILRYFKAVVKKEPTAMILLLINKIVLYNDRIEIYYNYCDTKRPDDEHRVFSFYTKVVKIIKNSNDTEPADYDVVAYI